MAHDAWQVIEQNCLSLLAEIQGQPYDPECNKCNQLIDALERIRDYRGLVGENDPQSVANDALAEITTSDTPDINAIADQFIGQVMKYYDGYSEDELSQVFARGPFAGMSERELYWMVKHWDNNRKVIRLEPNTDN